MPKIKSSPNEYLAEFDRMPQEERQIGRIRKSLEALAEFYGFEKISTSIVENYRVFLPLLRAGVLGENLPVFGKTKVGAEIFLRPAGVLGVLRSYMSQKMNDLPHPLRFSFEGERYSLASHGHGSKIYSRPEWGIMMIGEEGPIAEAEIIQVIWKAIHESGLDLGELALRVNATGCSVCRSSFRSSLNSYFRTRSGRMCKNCRRLSKRNPTKILLCEEEKCKVLFSHAPQVLDFLCEACKKHLRGFLEFLDEVGIAYFLDPKLFKDGSWFNTLIFEAVVRPKAAAPVEGEVIASTPQFIPPPSRIPHGLAAGTEGNLQSFPRGAEPHEKAGGFILAEGGRVSHAAEIMVGRRLDVASASFFFDTWVLMLASARNLVGKEEERPKVFLTQLGELAKRKSLVLLETLRKGGVGVRESLGRDSIKSQLTVAGRVGAEIALILGQKEALDNTIIVREVSSGIQETIPQDKLIEFLKKKLKASPKN